MTISVIVATFGDGYWSRLARRRAVPSVCAQTVQPLELIRRHRGTLAEARNDAALHAQGEWLCFLDADDELAPGYLAAMAAAARAADPASALLVPAVAYLRTVGLLTPGIIRTGRPLADVNRAVIGTLVSRDLFWRAGGFAEWPLYEDWDLWLRCCAHGASLHEIPDAVYVAWQLDAESRNRAPRAVQVETYEQIRHALRGYCADRPAARESPELRKFLRR